MRTHPVTRVRSMHTGVDIAAPLGSPAVAGEVGEVIYAGWFGAYGWTVVLDHGGGISSMYPHLSKITVKEGQIVGRGEEVGKIGSSGVSTGPHIHFEIRKNGDPINPWTYLR
jgi:murein DD-endopeptidase MepM/ murein hydrolase activator NlpD